jgi:predicted short-subunit dehydrogenase-like oxidoreductase (DUF2520 family)
VRFVFFGHGRLARHLSFYLQTYLPGVPVLVASRRGAEFQFQNNDRVFISVGDRDLPKTHAQLRSHAQKESLHLEFAHGSGSVFIEDCPSYHPLMTFGHDLYEPSFYCRIPFICEQGHRGFQSFFTGLVNPTFEIPSEQKAHYHSLVAAAANLPQQIWKHVGSEWQSTLKLPFSCLEELLLQSVKNSMRDFMKAPTGALVRKDQPTIESHINHLKDHAVRTTYQVFAQETQP